MVAQPAASVSGAGRHVALAIICLICAVNFGDRQLIAVLVEPIRHEFRLSDTEMGLLTGPLFAVAYCFFGIPLAWLADRTSRVRVLAAACMVWSVFTMLSGLAASFWQLALVRIGVGIGEAGGSPPSYALIAERYQQSRLALALSFFGYAGILGAAAGTALGAWVAAAYDWRMSFVIAGIPGIALGLALIVCVRDIRPGEIATDPKPSLFATIGAYFATPVLVYLTVAGALAGLLTYGMLNWTPALLMREKGMTLAELGSYYSVVNAVCMGIGLFSAGYFASRFSGRFPRIYVLLPMVTFLLSVPVMILALAQDHWPGALFFLSLTGGLLIVHGPLALALVQSAVPPSQRSTASAVYALIATVTGLGAGPLLIGAISDVSGSLNSSMLALIPLFVVAAVFFGLTAASMKRANDTAPARGFRRVELHQETH